MRASRSLPSTRVLVVTGLKREAACLKGRHVRAICSGADGWRLRNILRSEPDDFDLVMSFGLAAGLDPRLKPGEAVIGTYVLGDRKRYDADEAGCSILLEALAGVDRKVVLGPVKGVDRLVGSPGEKASLRTTGALIADMESHIAAEWAAARRVPFTIMRVVADPAIRALPENAASCVRQDGGLDAVSLMRMGITEWKKSLQALRLGQDICIAMAALRRYGVILGKASLGGTSFRHFS